MKSPQLTKIFGPKSFQVKVVFFIIFVLLLMLSAWFFVLRVHTEVTRVTGEGKAPNTCNKYILENGAGIEENCKLEAITGYPNDAKNRGNADVLGSPKNGDRVVVFNWDQTLAGKGVSKTMVKVPF